MAAVRIAVLTIRLVMRTKVALFFTFFFPLVFLFVYAGLFAHGNPQAVAYMFGPVVTLNIMGSGFWGLGLQSVMQRERGSLRRYRLAPIGAGTIVSSSLLANYLLGLPTVGLLVLSAHLVYQMPLKIGLLNLLLLVTVGTFTFAGFGLTIASVANTMQEAQIYNNLAWLTLLFLSGTSIPLPLLPHWIQRLATFLPATYLVSAFQAVMVRSQPLSGHWPELLALTISGTFGLLLAWKLFRWEKEERIPPRRKAWSLAFVVPFLLTGLWMNTRSNPTASWALSYSLVESGSSGSPATPENLIENFENSLAPEYLKDWRLVADSNSATNFFADLSLVSPGAAGTQHALRLQGRKAPAPARPGSVIARYKFAPPSARELQGIEFWVRGDPRVVQIRLFPEGSPPENYLEIRLVPSRDWQLVRLPYRGATKAAEDLPQASPWTLELMIPSPPSAFFVEIDEIKSY